ncbi:unnamed protein product [Angiostrongylus costaricensis]|uniref:MADF domain-containing protein n=1 Tax=Angiostrongylus costaricensis TaxID=334426 RepID=A0A158PDX0_ANGCS|nr:unnamed protein product [Angiostrongylus costaricensis]
MSMKVRYYWTVPLREALAVSVEKREKLWKKFPCVSHDAELRAKLWAEVADELNEQFGVTIDSKKISLVFANPFKEFRIIAAEDMKKTWKNLKDNYWRMMKTFENDPERVKRWRFFKLMKFMERANIDDSSSSNLELPNKPSSLIPMAKNESVSTAQAGNENQELSQPGKKVRRSRKARTKKMKKSDPLPTSTTRPRNLIQVCIPEIDSVIQTKQRPQIGAQIYSVAVDDVEDILTTELLKTWDEDVLQKDAMLAEPVNQRIQSSVISVDALIYISQNVNYISCETRLLISNYAAKLRGIYHQAAFSLFLKENMPSGQLHTLLDAFDDFVYNKKPKASIVSKV